MSLSNERENLLLHRPLDGSPGKCLLYFYYFALFFSSSSRGENRVEMEQRIASLSKGENLEFLE